MEDWEQIRAWRRDERAELLARRSAVPAAEKSRVQTLLQQRIRDHFPELRNAVIGFYWPIRGEFDLSPLVGDYLASGAEAGLPVIVHEHQPLQFWKWNPGMKLVRGVWNIPVPAEPALIQPSVLLVPLVGFDTKGYRLGYGGGYYDRTLAAMMPRPMTIGVGYEFGNLETIYPQSYDVPLDAIVTESRIQRFA